MNTLGNYLANQLELELRVQLKTSCIQAQLQLVLKYLCHFISKCQISYKGAFKYYVIRLGGWGVSTKMMT